MQDKGSVGPSEWQGQTGESWADEWRRTDRSFGMLTERLLQRSRDFAFSSALDIGCGAGELALAIARGRPQCRVTGLDISPQLIEVARERGANHHNVTFELADAANWQPEASAAFDLLISRHGVMFFDRPAAAFAHMRTLAAPGASLLFSCFRTWNENPVFTEAGRLVTGGVPTPDPDIPGPFAFGDRDKVERVLADAGWTGIAIEPFDFAMIVGAGEDPIADTVSYFSRIGSAARAVRALDGPGRAQFVDRARLLAQRNLREGIVSLRAAAWIVTARAP